jgi:hypothetical protein
LDRIAENNLISKRHTKKHTLNMFPKRYSQKGHEEPGSRTYCWYRIITNAHLYFDTLESLLCAISCPAGSMGHARAHMAKHQ